MLYHDYWLTPVGCPQPFIYLQANQQGITRLSFCVLPTEPPCAHPLIEQCKAQLADYFLTGKSPFTVPIVLSGTPFQQQVWRAVLAIPFGQTRSYQYIARQIHAVNAQRAVGSANSRSPLALIIPCHRVVSSSGHPSGSGSGLLMRTWLLAHEQQMIWQNK